MMKQDVRRLSSRYTHGGRLMYPGDQVFTWAQIAPGVWMLVSIGPLQP